MPFVFLPFQSALSLGLTGYFLSAIYFFKFSFKISVRGVHAVCIQYTHASFVVFFVSFYHY